MDDAAAVMSSLPDLPPKSRLRGRDLVGSSIARPAAPARRAAGPIPAVLVGERRDGALAVAQMLTSTAGPGYLITKPRALLETRSSSARSPAGPVPNIEHASFKVLVASFAG